jgi:hypothetical protein
MRIRIFSTALLFFAGAFFSWSQQPFQSASPAAEEALRARVIGYYELFQKGNFRRGEDFVTEESKDAYYNMNKIPHMGMSIKSMTFSDDAREARVLVAIKMIVPMVSQEPVPIPVASTWKLVEGEWYAHFPLPKPGDVVDTPFGRKTVKENKRVADMPSAGFFRPDANSLGKMFALERNRVQFPTSAPGPITETILIENRSQGRLQIRPLSNPVKGLDFKLTPADIPAGEETTLTLVYQPAVRQLRRQQQLRFHVDPIARRFAVKVDFWEREWTFQDRAGVTYGKPVTVTGEGRQSLDITGLRPNETYRVIARAKMLEGDTGAAFISIRGATIENITSSKLTHVAVGEQRLFSVDFKTDTSAKMRVTLGYRGTFGRVRWSEVMVVPFLTTNPPVPNGGFENVLLNPWRLGIRVGNRLVSSLVHSGKRSMELSGKETGYIYQDVAGLTPEESYQVKAWIRAAPGKPAMAALSLHDGKSRNVQKTRPVDVSVTKYEPLILPFTASETGIVRIHLVFHEGPPVYFDDVTVSHASISNAGFEGGVLGPWVAHGKGRIVIGKDVVLGGSQSLVQIGEVGSVSQMIQNLDPGKHYQAVAWARSAPGGDARVSLRLGDGRIKDGPRMVSGDNFEPFVVDFEPNPDGTIRLTLARVGGVGAIYWDDVIIRQRH